MKTVRKRQNCKSACSEVEGVIRAVKKNTYTQYPLSMLKDE